MLFFVFRMHIFGSVFLSLLFICVHFPGLRVINAKLCVAWLFIKCLIYEYIYISSLCLFVCEHTNTFIFQIECKIRTALTHRVWIKTIKIINIHEHDSKRTGSHTEMYGHVYGYRLKKCNTQYKTINCRNINTINMFCV